MFESDTMFNEQDRRCAAVQLMLSYRSKLWQQDYCQHPQNGLPRITGTCPGWRKQSFRLRLWSLVWFQVRATSCHLTSLKSLESQHQSVPGCAEECGDPLAGGRPWVWQQDSAPAHKFKETQAWLQKECYDFVPFSHWPPPPQPEPTGLLRLVIRREHQQHDLLPHQSQPDCRHPPSIHRACGKGMLPVPDPYRGGDWGWRRLHWIDVSSTT